VPALRELIASVPANERGDGEVEAARALGRIGPAAGAALPGLVSLLLKYPDPARKFFGPFNNNVVIVRALERVAAGSPDKLGPHLARVLRRTPDVLMDESLILSPGQFDRRIGPVEMIASTRPKPCGG
jgi:hypothetical protein